MEPWDPPIWRRSSLDLRRAGRPAAEEGRGGGREEGGGGDVVEMAWDGFTGGVMDRFRSTGGCCVLGEIVAPLCVRLICSAPLSTASVSRRWSMLDLPLDRAAADELFFSCVLLARRRLASFDRVSGEESEEWGERRTGARRLPCEEGEGEWC